MRFEDVVSAFGTQMYAHALRRLRDREAARDAVQDWALRVFQRLEGVREEAALKSWCYQIMNNLLTDRERARARRPETDGDSVLEQLEAPVPSRVRTTIELWWKEQCEKMSPLEKDLIVQGECVKSDEKSWKEATKFIAEKHGVEMSPEACRKESARRREKLEERVPGGRREEEKSDED